MQESCVLFGPTDTAHKCLSEFVGSQGNWTVKGYFRTWESFASGREDSPDSMLVIDAEGAARHLHQIMQAHSRGRKVMVVDSLGNGFECAPVPSENQADKEAGEDRSVFYLDRHAIYVRFDSRIFRISLKDLIYVEAQKDYVILHTHKQEFRILGSMKRISAELGDEEFHRVHRSFLVRLDKILYFENENLQLEGVDQQIPIGPSFRSPLLKGLRLL